jgi:5-methylcytosine-specific restriction endonuclease McrA
LTGVPIAGMLWIEWMTGHRAAYRRYMSSQKWRVRRSIYFATHVKKCKACGSTDRIHLHHKTYINFTKELDEDLCPLCERCHDKVHKLAHRGWTLESATDNIINRGIKHYSVRPKRKPIARKKK